MNANSSLLLMAMTLIACHKIGNCQQCRYVTVPVCGDNPTPSTIDIIPTKGDKGDRGFSGKIGPKGGVGSKGGVGEKGSKGNTAEVEELQEHLSQRIDAMQSTLNQLLLPPNCASSSVVGYQTLRSGEQVYCDGGWRVFQRRYDGSVNFQRNWNEYKNGFGNFSAEFWLGLDELHDATNGRGCRLRVDLWSFEDDHAFAEYSDFFVENESDNYRLHVGGYNGTAGDCFNFASNVLDEMKFTTPDRDNDRRHGANCASTAGHGNAGGWWFNSCAHCQLNANWSSSQATWNNILWYHWKGSREPLKATVMKFRCD